MNQDEARAIATRIVDTWPNGPKAYIWRNELAPLDHDTANETFRLMRIELDRATTAAFHDRYKAITRRRTNPPPPPPDDGEAISLDEAITRLEARAAQGDQYAAEAVAGLRKYRPTLATITAQPTTTTTDPDYEDPF